MQDLSQTLSALEERLSELEPQKVDRAAPADTRAQTSIAGLAEIADHLRRMRNPYISPNEEAAERAFQPPHRDEAFSEPPHYRRRLSDRIGTAAPEYARPQAAPAEHDALHHIDGRLNEISRALIATNKLQRPSREEAERMDRIEKRLAALTAQLDSAFTREDSDALFRRLGELSQRIDALQTNASLPEQMVEQLACQVQLLATQIGKVVENLSRSDYRRVEARLEAISERLEAAERRAHEHHPAVLDQIDRRFAELTERLDAHYASRYGASSADSEAIHNLEQQIASIAQHLAQPSRELSEIRPRLDSIERSLHGNREIVLDAAREATESAVARMLQHGPKGETAIAQQLAADMKALETLARNADDRNTKTFEAVHDTLTQVVERLAGIEKEMSAKSAVSAPIKAPVFSSPAAPAPVKFPQVEKAAAHISRPHEPFFKSDFASLKPARRENPVHTQPPAVKPDVKSGPRAGDETVLDLNSIMKRVREERRQQEDGSEAPKTAATSKVDFITAARRAAQLAATQSEQIEKDAAAPTEKKKASIADILHRQRKPILFAIGAVMIAIAGLQVGTAFLNRDSDIDPAVNVAAEKPAAIDMASTGGIQTIPTTINRAAALPTPQMPPLQAESTVDDKMPALPSEPQASAQFSPPETEQTAAPEPQKIEIPSIPEEAGPAALREAAAKGDMRALFEIGNRYMEGRGVAANVKEAAKWYQLAADQGFAPAQYRIGSFNEKGLGMARNLEKAKNWYQLAADQGNASAMHNLAVLFATGTNGTPDNAAAVRWFTEAAELGVKDSQYNLGILAAKGLGMPVNLEESYKWFALAANAGDKDAAEKRDQIAKALKPEMLARAKGAVELWKAKPLDDAANSIDVPDAWTEAKPLSTSSVDMKKAVRNIQLILQKNGYDTGTADGMMGAKTRTAISAFQKANGQEPTGEVNQKLVQLLLKKNK
ncbi:peptidoglycan-binding protein [Brucella sp. 2716]|uniref:peptidoglycan-binding protein n=1 Tax=Brucella sp. 2716 TaxID=2975052 RepID=UPI00217D64AB|nr:peptidoglycan-binding protein [Brucella sp. 2716]UWF61065.1 peptidoglycan-binding protein [Brucella sp. 2716]